MTQLLNLGRCKYTLDIYDIIEDDQVVAWVLRIKPRDNFAVK